MLKRSGLRSFPSGSLLIMDAITGTETLKKNGASLVLFHN